jgi:hypothetical protein
VSDVDEEGTPLPTAMTTGGSMSDRPDRSTAVDKDPATAAEEQEELEAEVPVE